MNFSLIFDHFDQFNSLNMYSSLLIILLGLTCNLISTFVLFHAKNRQPKFNCINSFIFVTLTNVFQLIVHFYTSTLNRIIYHYDLKDQLGYLQGFLFDSSQIGCMLFFYFPIQNKLTNLSVVLLFSYERTLSVYYPLKNFNTTIRYLFVALLLFSFGFPVYLLIFGEIVEIKSDMKHFVNNFNTTRNFQIRSLTPIFNGTVCSVSPKHEQIYSNLHMTSIFLILLSNTFISLFIVLIFVKLKIRNRIQKRANSTTFIQSTNSFQKGRKRSIVENKLILDQRNSSTHFMMRSSLNPKIKSTKVLLILSSSSILLNFPFFMLYFFVLNSRQTFTVKTGEELLERIKLINYLSIVDILQLLYSSIAGLLLFACGKIFRFHFKGWLKSIWR
jgi:hypothetical protein